MTKLRRPMPVGIDSFSEIIETGSYFIDKTLLIRDLIDSTTEVTLFTRPRRFAKTTTLSMIETYFALELDEKRGRAKEKNYKKIEISGAFKGIM